MMAERLERQSRVVFKKKLVAAKASRKIAEREKNRLAVSADDLAVPTARVELDSTRKNVVEIKLLADAVFG